MDPLFRHGWSCCRNDYTDVGPPVDRWGLSRSKLFVLNSVNPKTSSVSNERGKAIARVTEGLVGKGQWRKRTPRYNRGDRLGEYIIKV